MTQYYRAVLYLDSPKVNLYADPNRYFETVHLEESMQKILGMMILIAGASQFAMATAVPEIGVGSAGSAIALISGAMLVIRGRRK
jgi:hypothetical protein